MHSSFHNFYSLQYSWHDFFSGFYLHLYFSSLWLQFMVIYTCDSLLFVQSWQGFLTQDNNPMTGVWEVKVDTIKWVNSDQWWINFTDRRLYLTNIIIINFTSDYSLFNLYFYLLFVNLTQWVALCNIFHFSFLSFLLTSLHLYSSLHCSFSLLSFFSSLQTMFWFSYVVLFWTPN